tara:strand:- start:151 stop:309 length:159 start_codon:yes stop_codon:yes gene_type:complete
MDRVGFENSIYASLGEVRVIDLLALLLVVLPFVFVLVIGGKRLWLLNRIDAA